MSFFKLWMERNLDKYREDSAGESWFPIPRYNKSSSTCIPNMRILACMVLEKSLTKNVILQSIEGKKIGQIQGRISRRRLVHNPTIQQDIINLHTKDEYSTLHGCCEIFDENFNQSMEGKEIGQIKGRIRGEGWFLIPRYNKSSSTCIPNMSILACMVVEKSLTKNFHQKRGRTEGTDGRKDGRTDRCKPVYP